jgi:hypothetical protein
VFACSLGLVVIGLGGLLLGVRMEAVEPATGIVTARELTDVRSLLSGLIEPGWYEGDVTDADGHVIGVRLDALGDGVTVPVGESRHVIRYRVGDKLSIPRGTLSYHRLQPGDELWPGQPLAAVRADEERLRLRQVEERLRQWQSSGNHGSESEQARHEAELLRLRLAMATLRVPERNKVWQAVQVCVSPLQAVRPGDVIAVIVPVDPATHQPLDLVARLEVDEKHAGSLAPGQTVRLASTTHNHRLHGRAEARIERVEPWGEPRPDGTRRYTIIAPFTEAPFPVRLGSSVQAEIVVGRKLAYRIILEH